jgi:hypothetical protein
MSGHQNAGIEEALVRVPDLAGGEGGLDINVRSLGGSSVPTPG